MAKFILKQKAISLRKKGIGIGTIAKTIGVGKSTVSYWCRDIVLSPAQLNKLQREQIRVGTRALMPFIEERRKQRMELEKKLIQLGKKDVGDLTKRDLFLTGLALYWGEGYRKGNQELGFTNSDPNIIRFFVKWLKKIHNISEKELILRVSINNLFQNKEKPVLQFWSKLIKVPLDQFTKTSFIKSKIKKVYPNHLTHYGTLRVKVRRGTNLRRRIMGSLQALSN